MKYRTQNIKCVCLHVFVMSKKIFKVLLKSKTKAFKSCLRRSQTVKRKQQSQFAGRNLHEIFQSKKKKKTNKLLFGYLFLIICA